MAINLKIKFNLKIILPAILVFASSFSLSSCGIWGDFTTYFNTYYNASLLFEDAMTEIVKLRKDLFEFKEVKINSKISKNLEKVIEKTSSIMQFHAESSYFEEALFMTGKSFYWKQEYSKSLRKFQELATIKGSDLALENRMWIGKAELQLRNFDDGYAVLETVKNEAEKSEEEDIADEALITMIRFKLYRDAYADAISLIEELLKISSSDELNAEISYQLGRIYLKMGDNKNALAAFERVQTFDPTFDIEFNSFLEIAKLKKELGSVEESLILLQELSNNDKYEELWDKVDLEIANVLFDQGEYSDALSIYIEIDSTYSRTKSAGIAAFKAGEILSDYYYDYDSAMVYFNKTLSADSPAEFKIEARKKNKVINNYLSMNEKLKGEYKQLSYILDPDVFERDSLIYEDYRIQDSIKKAQAKLKRGGSRKNRNYNPRGNTARKEKVVLKPKRPTISADSLRTLISDKEFDMGNLFFGELNVPDSAFYYYNSSIQKNPQTLNKPKILFAMGNYYLTVKDSLKADSLFNYIYENYKYDLIVNEAAKKVGKPLIDFESDPGEPLYVQAEEKYLNSEFDSAVTGFLQIPGKYPNSRFAPQAYYTAGFILENDLSRPDSAASLYDSLVIKYRNTDYSKAVRKKLSFFKAILKHKMDSIKKIQDSIRIANLPPDSAEVKDTSKTKSLQDILKEQDEKVKKNKQDDDDERHPLSFLDRKTYYLKKNLTNSIV